MVSDSERALLLRMDGERGTEADMRRNPKKRRAPRIFDNKVCEMNPGSCKVDVSVCVQASNYLEEHSGVPKVTVSYDTLKCF
ncbi:hypothetical protein TNCV_569541 [Trichonephila clavipes]|nr:hypothetical protein TNCV_569541 [Trichonephila clavipes]